MAIEALEEGIQWNFQTFPEYLSMIEQQGVGPNVAVYIGHSALRTYVMGADATTRAANDDEIDAMRGLVAEAMNVGPLGFSSSTHEKHVEIGRDSCRGRACEDVEISVGSVSIEKKKQ